MAEIQLRDVQKHFGPVHVIKDLNLTIADREFVVLLGPSGCGKTTTLRAIAGLESIDAGDILIDGKPAANVDVLLIADGTRFRNAQEEMRVRTDAQGRFQVTFPKAGWYWLNASMHDAENLTAPATQRRASYAATFEVQPQ